MTGLTITDAGISLKSFQELRNEIKEAWISRFGEGIDLSPTSVDGHHIDLECKTILSVLQLLEVVISNFDPNKASGIWLDIIGDYKSMERLMASYSIASVKFEGEEGVSVPEGTVVKYEGSPCKFVLTEDIVIGSNGFAIGLCKAEIIGAVDILVGEWKMVSSSPAGVTCLVESASGVGRNVETDSEFRERIRKKTGEGLATYDKMFSYMASVIGVGNFSLYVNEDDREVDGLPAHRFEFVINNNVGTNDEIAQAIWDCKPAGIKSYGSTTGLATDIVGVVHEMMFSRITNVKLWISIVVTEYLEEKLPKNFKERIIEEVEKWADTEYNTGKDVIPKRIYTPVFRVSGILDVIVKVCISDTEPDESDYVEEVISVQASSKVEVANVKVEIG